ncbi:MAG: 16S rRNA pseudouridine(516) synthase [Burkholderiaceae bacterium]
MSLAQVLFSQGFGTRRECQGLIASGQVNIDGRCCDDPLQQFDTAGLTFRVRGVDWPYREHALIVLHKPQGYECSQQPRHHPSVYSLLPEPLRRRDVQAIGRLDADTTGLLLFSDDGALVHRLTSPRQHIPKVYEAICKHPVDQAQAQRLRDGVMLHGETDPVRAAACELSGANQLRLSLLEGKYHQVKRMIAAVGNRVESLHRCSFGALALPADLGSGHWRWLDGPHLLAAEPVVARRR